jgi:hypothetical protein
MIVVQALLMAGVAPAQIRVYPLDERSVTTVRVSVTEPTTCVFPGPIKALIGTNLSTKLEEKPGVLLSHEAGAEFFSLRAVKEEAVAALNVMYRGRVYALVFAEAKEPDRAVVFMDRSLIAAEARHSTEALRTLLERARQHDRLVALYPAMSLAVSRSRPQFETLYRTFKATVEEVIRFDLEDVLVLRVRLQNESERPVTYDPTSLAVRVGTQVFRTDLAEASGAIPPRSSTAVYLVIAGAPVHGRANLTVDEEFVVIVPQP